MADFSISFKPGSDMIVYLKSIENNVKRTPFLNAKIFFQDDMAFIHIKPLLFPFYWFAPLLWIIGYVLNGSLNWVIISLGLIPGLIYPFYNKYFYIMMLYIGKRKAKVKGDFKVI